METYRVNLGIDMRAKSLDDIKEIVFRMRKLVAEAAKGKATSVNAELLGCEVVKKSDD